MTDLSAAPARPPRLIAIDWFRTAAFVAMACFHFGRDLEILGLVAPGTTFGGGWDIAARAIAASFLALAGLSLWLACGRGMRWRGFLRRLALLVAAAAGVSLATYLAVPGAWVRFGILHSIALASILSLAFLRAPWWATAGAAAAVLYLAPMLRGPAFDGALWFWSGLGTRVPLMIDYEPMVPWLAPMLAGLAFGQGGGARLLQWGDSHDGRLARALAWPGRHALALYLIHQPVLLAVIFSAAWVWQRV